MFKKVVTLPKDKETPGTFVYKKEIDGRPVSFYLPKSWLDGQPAPESIDLTIATRDA